MWFLIKSSVGLVVLALAAYTVFFVDMAGKPLADHTRDIWVSEVVQEKVDLVRTGVAQELEDKVAQVAEQQARQLVRGNRVKKTPKPVSTEFNSEDQDSLDQVIAQD